MDGESLEEHKAMMMTPLSAMAEAFEELDKVLRSREDDQQLRLDTFCEACSLVSVLFGCLGFAFKFAEVDYVSKVRDLKEASRTSNTLQDILDLDVANDTVKIQGSLSRNLRRVRQGLDLVRALFEQFLTTDQDCYLKEAASRAYRQVCAPYHSWTVRTAVVAGMCALPTRNQLLLKLNETGEFEPRNFENSDFDKWRYGDPKPDTIPHFEQSAGKKMRRYIDASLPVIDYIDKLYLSRNISLDW